MLRRCLSLSLLLVVLAGAQERFNGANAFRHIQQLCRAEYKGRKTGMAEAHQASLWIVEQFKSWGLQPMGDHGGYLQEFPMIVTEQKGKAKLKLHNSSYGVLDYVDGLDFVPYMNSGSGNITAEVAFVGYGISAPEMGWDDYAGVEVKGKIVLIQRGMPADGQDWSSANERFYKVRIAAARGAIGLLMLDRGDWPMRGVTVTGEGYQPNMPIFNISKKVARDLFIGCHKNLDHVIRDLAKKPQSFILPRTLSMSIRVDALATQKGENVLAVLPGTDPVLAEEFLVVGGHMDHNGLSADDRLLYAGADDNASGTAVVMELARIFSRHKCKRSIVFACFGGEEQGLLGSWFFAHHPTIAAEKIAAMLNFDMEGCGDGGAHISGRNYWLEPMRSWTGSHDDSVRRKLTLSRGPGIFGSDHAFFVEQGIPAVYFSSSGDHPFYHQFEDDPSTINLASLQFVGDRAAELLDRLAAAPTLLYQGNRSGRFFYLFGDQIDFSAQPWSALAHADSLLQRAVPAAVHCIVYQLDSGTQADLFTELEQVEQQIIDDSTLIRFKNSAQLNEAAAQARLAVAVILNGTARLQGKTAYARMLCRAGVNWLSIQSTTDPIFSQNGLSDWGRSLLQAWSEENGLLDCTIADTAQVASLLSVGQSKVMLRLRQQQAVALADWLKRKLQDKRLLLILEATPDQPVEPVWKLVEQLPAAGCHVAFTKPLAINDEYKYQWLQKLYDIRKNTEGVAKTYSVMLKLFGENLKTFTGK